MQTRAFNGRIVTVQLSTGESYPETLPDSFYRAYLGGYGAGARLLLDRLPAGADSLGPDNLLGFFPGLLTGTPLFAQRFQIVTKSPLTGGWGDSNCGGKLGPFLKLAGWDGLLVAGQAETPTYLLIQDEEIRLCPAGDLWGLDALETERRLRERYGKRATVACIGPAGEKLSLISGILNDGGRMAARSGVGAVMGSKRLKAVVCISSRAVLAQTSETLAMVRQGLDEFVRPTADFFRTYGTSGMAAASSQNGDAPIRNWAGSGSHEFPQGSALTGDAVNERMEKRYACWHCPLACGAEASESGTAEFPYPAGTHRPEYETMASFGALSLNDDLDAITYANHLCNAFGLDTISAGTVIAFAIECYERGLLTSEDTDGLVLRWGDAAAIVRLLELIGRREGIGDLLADGVKRAAERIGRGADEFAMHIGGQELPMHDPKLQPEYYTTYKLDPTPARHTQYEASRRFGAIPPAPRSRTQERGRGKHHKVAAEYMHLVNAGGFCQFVMQAANTARIPDWVHATTGWDVTREELLQAGERIANLRMVFEVREGGNPAQRRAPRRLYDGSQLPGGPNQEITLDTETLEQEFLVEAGWDPQSSRPSQEKLRSLGLSDLIPVIYPEVSDGDRCGDALT